MSKKNKQQLDTTETATIKEVKQSSNYAFVINDKQALIITLFIAAISYCFSFFYTSFYQGEEGAQYMDALAFSHNLSHTPIALMGNWPKTGWKLIFGPIAVLFGKQGVLITNCLFASFAGFFAYKLASKIIEKKTALPFIFLISQTLWFLLAYKFYSEIPTAFLLVLGLYLFYCEKYIVASLTLSYVLLLRQEFVFVMPYFAFILLKRKQWISFFCLGIFSLLYNLVGFIYFPVDGKHDWLYSVHESINYAKTINNTAPRQGFDNFFVMSGAIYNHVIIGLVALYFAQIISKQVKKVEWAIVVPAVGFFIVHCLFNLQAYPIFTTTGGNLRYVLVISPLLAVLAAKAIDNMQYIEKRNVLWFFMIPFVCLVAGYMTYYHNWIGMNVEGDKDRTPVLLAIAIVAVVLLIKSNALVMKVSAALCVLTMLIYIRPKELCCDENYEQKKVTDYVLENKLDKKFIMQDLALMNFFVGKNNWDYPNGCSQFYGDSVLDKAKPGTIIIWDSHYATKYGKVQGEYINKNIMEGKMKVIKEFRSEDQTFAAVILEKIAQ